MQFDQKECKSPSILQQWDPCSAHSWHINIAEMNTLVSNLGYNLRNKKLLPLTKESDSGSSLGNKLSFSFKS